MRRTGVPVLALLLLGCGSGSHKDVAPAATGPSCEGRNAVSLTFIFYGEEGANETIALVCDGDEPRAVVDESEAPLEWSRWERAWIAIEGLDSACRPQANCPPEPDTAVDFTDADHEKLSCVCARDELVEAVVGAAVDAGLHVKHAR